MQKYTKKEVKKVAGRYWIGKKILKNWPSKTPTMLQLMEKALEIGDYDEAQLLFYCIDEDEWRKWNADIRTLVDIGKDYIANKGVLPENR